ncbi:hypothetical protein SDC9_74452 [bioreactor metagenome]|uniref:Three-Cys-motif partner protein TcmP n=1 Tax=bioreactor metagenome TaxID=1076179 RepID=A0A644YHG2_9ZZZZ
MNQDFFDEQTEQSRKKAKIVHDYFVAWARVIKSHWTGPIGYIDLYCGPGKYSDGTPSVPLLIINEILNDSELASRMFLVFNDADGENIRKLEEEIKAIPKSEDIIKRIAFSTNIVDGEFWEKIRINPQIPVLSYIDPFGYKGLTIELIKKLLASKGSDCIFFFNYNRINMAFSSNPYFDEHLSALFGKEKTTRLKKELASLAPSEREKTVIDALVETLKENTADYVLPFKFYCTDMKRTSHYIIFVTKHIAGCRIMKSIMYTNSAKDVDAVASFELKDRANFGSQSEQLSLFSRPLDELCELLKEKYKGRSENIKVICNEIVYDNCSVFMPNNVKDALRRLENEGVVKIEGRKKATINGLKTMPDEAFAIFM